MKKEISKKQFVIYLIFTFTVAWVLQIIASLCALNGMPQYFNLLLTVVMFVPLLGTLVSRIKFKEIGWKIKFKKKLRYILFAWFSPSILATLGTVLFFLIFPQTFISIEDNIVNVIPKETIDQLLAEGINANGFAMLTIFSAIIIAPFINALAAVGEESGWRGLMYPYLKSKFGKKAGRVVGGFIWGAWHWPVMILAGYEYGFGYFGAPYLGMLAFCIVACIFGILCDWVYEKSESIWIPSLLHGAINAFAGAPILFLNMKYTTWQILGPTLVGVISIIPMLIVALLILLLDKEKNNKNDITM